MPEPAAEQPPEPIAAETPDTQARETGVSPAKQGPPASREELAEDAQTVREAETLEAIPARFQGTFAEDLAACEARNHGNFTITGDEIRFFESRGKVRSVKVDGNYAAATVDETYVETSRYVFYMALEGVDQLRFRYDKNRRYTYVRCP